MLLRCSKNNMQTNTLKKNNPNKKSRQVGRGGRRGKTSGRGTKGQNARAGRKKRPEIRDTIKKYPKLRGYKFSSINRNYLPVNLDVIEKNFSGGDTVSPKILIEKGVINQKRGVSPKIKILGTGEISKKITVFGCTVSASAKVKIEKAGGNVAGDEVR